MDLERIKDRLRKMKALADFGYGGERDAAERLIREMCEKHDISIDEIESEVEREHTVILGTVWERKIFIQILGLMRIEEYGDRDADKLKLNVEFTPVEGKGRRRSQSWRRRYFTRCTDLQWLEMISKFDLLCASYRKQFKQFTLAFLMSNDLLMPYDPKSPDMTEKEKEEYETAMRLSNGIEKTALLKQLEDKKQEGR